MASPFKDEFAQAKSVVLRLLKIRNRSEKEIRDHLARKRFSQEVITRTIQDFKAASWVNDRQFAQDWIGWRLKRPLGLRRIVFELKAKGIDEDLIQEELTRSTQDYEEEKSIQEVAQRYLRKYGYFMTRPQSQETGAPLKAKEKSDRLKIKRRLFEYLARRGFTIESIQKTVESV